MTDTVKLLSDDEVTELQARPSAELGGYSRILLRPRERDALCATVRALRASDEHNYQLWLSLKERHEHKFASADGKWSDTCQQCGVTTGDDHDGHDCIAWLQRTNTALREQLAHWQERTRERTGEVERLQSRLAQVTQERTFAVRFLVKMGYERCTDEDHGHDCHWHERL